MFNFILKMDMFITNLIGNRYTNILNNFFSKETLDIFFKIITKFGEGYFEIFIVIFLYFLIKYRKKNEYYIWIKGVVYTFITSTIVVSILKRVIGRERPYVSFDPDRFYGIQYLYEHGLINNARFHSFPSGHTITIFVTVWFLYFNLKNRVLKICLFLLGILVGISRVYLLYHWTSDVLTSIILSYFIARIIDKKLKMEKSMIKFNIVENRC